MPEAIERQQMRRTAGIIALAVAASATCAHAAQDKPITQSDPSAVDVAKTPVTDLNIDSQKIPDLLIAAQREPYSLNGLRTCGQLVAAVNRFDALLGPDIDLPQEERDMISTGRVAKTVVGSLIPFRGLIREFSGANDHDRKVRAAIQAGLARRGFLKGVGQMRDCPYPARPATRQVIADYMARHADEGQSAKPKGQGGDKATYTSQPVIQKTP